MYTPRKTSRVLDHVDKDGIKLYAISASGDRVDALVFATQLAEMKHAAGIAWRETPGFAIFHQGARLPFLVLCWWGNDNELFVRVAVREKGGWVLDPSRFSFCLWDMEVMCFERKSYVHRMYSGTRDLAAYRTDYMVQK